jgi:hypothetical protein
MSWIMSLLLLLLLSDSGGPWSFADPGADDDDCGGGRLRAVLRILTPDGRLVVFLFRLYAKVHDKCLQHDEIGKKSLASGPYNNVWCKQVELSKQIHDGRD